MQADLLWCTGNEHMHGICRWWAAYLQSYAHSKCHLVWRTFTCHIQPQHCVVEHASGKAASELL